MSDDPGTSQFNIGTGVSLPDGEDATYNAGLTPLYMGRTGTIGFTWTQEFLGRGSEAPFWSSITRGTENAYRGFTTASINSLSAHSKLLGQPFRCLVSTNNG